MKYLVFDFEVFKYDVLLGVYDVNSAEYVQLWGDEAIRRFYLNNVNDAIWIGHNNKDYDNIILEAIVKRQSPYLTSIDIIKNNNRRYCDIRLYYYDLMQLHPGSLKVMEAAMGKNISESEVDFNIDRPLTEEEKKEVESYNRDDLNQTFEDLKLTKSEFQLRIDLIKEFDLPLAALHYTQTQIAERALKAEKDESLIDIPVRPIVYPQMSVENEVALDFYLNEGFRREEKPVVVLCGLAHQMGAGGMHAAREKCSYDWAYYLDVSGYYNLIMINYDLLSRAIPEEGKRLYEYMYRQQLALKGVNDTKRKVYKTILLAVFGAQMNKYCKFYDPWKGALVPVVGQMFLIDLLEKLEGKVELIQSNTDGIMVKPIGDNDEEVLSVVKEWCDRTHLVIKPTKIYDIVQRDVNNYMYRDDKGNVHTKGEAVGYYERWKNPLAANSYNCKEALIIQYCIVDYYMYGKKPEETIRKYENELRLFQYIVKLKSFDYLTFEKGMSKTRLQKVNRCFASMEEGIIYKNKNDGKHDRYGALPDKVFIHNEEINVSVKEKIDYNYYVRRAWERIEEFRPPISLFDFKGEFYV